MADIIDVSSKCGNRASALAGAGVKTIIRYYSRDTIRPSKRITREEAAQLSAAGLRLGIVHEGRFGDKASNFDRSCGVADGRYARSYGSTEIGQPGGTAIYFGVDFDAAPADIRARIVPYFQGVADAFAVQTGEPQYRVGVYGSGATCEAVLNAGLAHFAWLAQSTRWAGHAAFLASDRWALNQLAASTVAGVSCDPDVAGDNMSIGDFALAQAHAPFAANVAAANPDATMTTFVNARGGLHLRSGPGVEFNVTKLLPFGTAVHPLKSVGSWMSIDLHGDGAADGFVSSAYLTDTLPAGASSQGGAMQASLARDDAIHVPELIRQGSTVDGLKAARDTASAALPGYPHNGCAAHLSALLEQAGIDVPMTWGAGKLAHVLADRGWSKVNVGSQRPGDVGVCFDNTSPPGSDHIYLVISASGPDEMMIADNQRTDDAVHERFASGHDKTPTEYFLRAT